MTSKYNIGVTYHQVDAANSCQHHTVLLILCRMTAQRVWMTSFVTSFVTWGAGGSQTVKHLKASKQVWGCGAKADCDVYGKSCRNLVRCNRKSAAPKSSITVLIVMREYADCFAIEYPRYWSCSELSQIVPFVFFELFIIIFALGYCCQFSYVARDYPLKVICEVMASLLTGKPLCHLFNIVLLVAGPVCQFSEIDMEAFWALSAIAVSRTLRNDGRNIMLHWMKFWDIKVVLIFPNIRINKVM